MSSSMLEVLSSKDRISLGMSYYSRAFSNWKWPDIDGLHSFNGQLVHSANWPESCDFKNKKVAVIGIGSSGIQIVPKLATRTFSAKQ